MVMRETDAFLKILRVCRNSCKLVARIVTRASEPYVD